MAKVSNIDSNSPREQHRRRAAPTLEQLRYDIDRGATGDKKSSPDPAAAPLGTDAEAAGAPPGPEDVALASAQEHRSPRPQEPHSGPGANATPLFRPLFGFVLALIIALVAATLLVIFA